MGYTRGQRVTFTATMTARITAAGNGCMNVEVESVQVGDSAVTHWTHNGHGDLLFMSLDDNMVELVDPPNWPPLAGDVWEADGEEYFARLGMASQIIMIPGDVADGSYHFGEAAREADFKALNPVLVRRRASKEG